MGPIINLETSELMEKYSPSYPSPKLTLNSCIQYNPISSTSHNEHNSFEFQIQDIDTEINKFDGLREVNQDAEDQEVDSHPNTNTNNLALGEKIREPNLEVSPHIVSILLADYG